jgi:hypothetical protein
MNYKAILDKLAELEARIDLLERGQRKQTEFPGAPQWVDNMPRIDPRPTWQQPPWQITCKTNTEQTQ